MRSLCQYEGQRCRVQGRISLWENRGEHDAVLYEACQITGVDGWKTNEDHLWVLLPVGEWDRVRSRSEVSRLDKVGFMGTVTKYTRANGTQDYSVMAAPDLIPFSVYIMGKQGLGSPNGKRIKGAEGFRFAPYTWEVCLEILESGNLYNDYGNLTQAEFLDMIEKEKISIRKSIETAEAGRGKGAISRDPITIKMPKRQAARGFK